MHSMVSSIIDAVVLWIESLPQSHQAMKRMEHIKANEVTPSRFYPKLCVIKGPLCLHLLLGRIHVTVYERGLDGAREFGNFNIPAVSFSQAWSISGVGSPTYLTFAGFGIYNSPSSVYAGPPVKRTCST